MCDHCREEIGAEKYDEIQAFLTVWPLAEFGPAHIVVADYNIEPGHLSWCAGIIYTVQRARQLQQDVALYADHSDAELEATARLLRWLESGHHPVRLDLSLGQFVVGGWREILR